MESSGAILVVMLTEGPSPKKALPTKLLDIFARRKVPALPLTLDGVTTAHLQGCAGVMVTGMGAWPPGWPRAWPEREAFVLMMEWARKLGKPLLAAGHGHEAIAAAYGGQILRSCTGRWGDFPLTVGDHTAQTFRIHTPIVVTSAPLGWTAVCVDTGLGYARSVDAMEGPRVATTTAGTPVYHVSVSFRPELSGVVGQTMLAEFARGCGLAPVWSASGSRPSVPTRTDSAPRDAIDDVMLSRRLALLDMAATDARWESTARTSRFRVATPSPPPPTAVVYSDGLRDRSVSRAECKPEWEAPTDADWMTNPKLAAEWQARHEAWKTRRDAWRATWAVEPDADDDLDVIFDDNAEWNDVQRSYDSDRTPTPSEDDAAELDGRLPPLPEPPAPTDDFPEWAKNPPPTHMWATDRPTAVRWLDRHTAWKRRGLSDDYSALADAVADA